MIRCVLWHFDPFFVLFLGREGRTTDCCRVAANASANSIGCDSHLFREREEQMARQWFIRWLRARPHSDQSSARARPPSRLLGFETFEERDLLATITLTPVADNTIFQIP